eukprot:492613_1
MASKKVIQEMFVSMGFQPNYIQRGFKVYEKNYGHSYNVEVITEIIIRLQNKDEMKLNKRREYEKQEIRRLEDDGCPQDCALNMKWANQWRNFVHNKTNVPPRSIDNRRIHSHNHALKEGLIKDTDYLMIPSQIWTFLIGIYGGGPKIEPINTSKRMHNRNETEDDTVNNKSDAPANGNIEEKHHPLSHDTPRYKRKRRRAQKKRKKRKKRKSTKEEEEAEFATKSKTSVANIIGEQKQDVNASNNQHNDESQVTDEQKK